MFGRSLVSPHQAQLLEERARHTCASRQPAPRSGSGAASPGSKTGFPFRRQLVIGPYIVDFACTTVRLVVEVDGPYHEDRARPDAQRDRLLTDLGWTVLRIRDHLVFQDLDAVVRTIVAKASALR